MLIVLLGISLLGTTCMGTTNKSILIDSANSYIQFHIFQYFDLELFQVIA